MPLLPPPAYVPPLALRNAHAHTIYAGRFRRGPAVPYRRARLDLPDGDFVDLDWLTADLLTDLTAERRRVAVLSHGLEGSTARAYMRGMADALFAAGWDVLAWNYRGCGGTPNRLPRAYHSGATADLDLVVRHALETGGYAAAALVGFSLGGNLTLRYLGERGAGVDARVRGAVAFGTPVDLASSSVAIHRFENRVYHQYFMVKLRAKLAAKIARFPEALGHLDPRAVRTLHDFDDRFTAPAHGFLDAADYYARCSAKPLLPEIRVPTLLVNPADDPFLAAPCYPTEAAEANPDFFLEVPTYGGHIGFASFNGDGRYWSERRAVGFLDAVRP